MPLPIVLIGAGGHAKVVADIIRKTGAYEIIGCTDPRKDNALISWGIKYLGTDEILPDLLQTGVNQAAMGLAGFNNTIRRRLYEKIRELGFIFPVLSHPAASIAPGVRLSEAAIIMAAAVINPDVTVGENVIINTGAIIEHDCIIGHSAQIGPGAILCGGVIIEEGAFIGAGACIIQGKRIGRGAIIGSGAIVIEDVPAGVTVVGNPARIKP
ncbi:acetyltransferase [Moorella sulfitireducens (nom. illeg.)]|uniref:acetyltransferase n=1 Tax=Neomoorella sulfitireducens TaxID=2972948 RepID=UPI0021AC0DFC|nr:acetyltransferase [Moorella sulfitireducens]